MKKLMIAAAIAAMIGGVAEASYYYDFTASVKTTKGAKGKDVKTTYTVQIGMDSEYLWYDTALNDGKCYNSPVMITTGSGKWSKAPSATGTTYRYGDIVDLYSGNYDVIVAGVVKYTYQNGNFKKAELDLANCTDEEKEAIAEAFGFNTTTKTTTFSNKSAGKYCQTFKYTHTDYASCYRVAATKTIKGTIYADDCCAFINPWQINVPEYTDTKWVAIDNLMEYRFGAQSVEKANKVEYIGRVGTLNNVANRNSAPVFAMAGQGVWTKLGKDATNQPVTGLQSISGNIVGSLPPSNCQDCCQYPADAIAFECITDDIAWQNQRQQLMHATAAFGTWSMKLNKKNSGLK